MDFIKNAFRSMTSTNFGEKNVFLGQNCRQYRAKRVFYENHVFFFLGKLSSARDSASSVLIFLQIHSPPCSDFDPHGSESARYAFFFFGGGGGVRKQNDKTREPPGPGPGPGPGWQATGPGQSSSKQTDKQAHTVQNPQICFPNGRLCRQPIQLVDWPGCLSVCTEYGDIS